MDGTDGINGNDGMDGTDGINGNDGSDGHNALAVTSTEPAGANCTNGGIKIDVGVDDNDDGALQATAIGTVCTVCTITDVDSLVDFSGL
jgi:hypothetical protein